MKTPRTKEYYKAQAAKLAARQRYDTALNPASIAPEILNHTLTISPSPTDLEFDIHPTVAELLAHDGQPNQDFWGYWNTTWAPGAMKLFNPREDILRSGVRVGKAASGKWTLIVNGVSAL
jgi:hypothetical protein